MQPPAGPAVNVYLRGPHLPSSGNPPVSAKPASARQPILDRLVMSDATQ